MVSALVLRVHHLAEEQAGEQRGRRMFRVVIEFGDESNKKRTERVIYASLLAGSQFRLPVIVLQVL